MSLGISMAGLKKTLFREKTEAEKAEEARERAEAKARQAELNKIYDEEFHKARKDVVAENARKAAKSNTPQGNGLMAGLKNFGMNVVASEQAAMERYARGGYGNAMPTGESMTRMLSRSGRGKRTDELAYSIPSMEDIIGMPQVRHESKKKHKGHGGHR